MSDAANKTSTFTVKVDERSFAIARRHIAELTADVRMLVREMNKVSTFGGGIFGGGTMNKGASGLNPGHESVMRGGSPVTQGIAADARALATSAKAGVDAMRQMTQGVKSGLSDQIERVQRLQRELSDLDRAYDRIGTNARGLARPDQGRFEGERGANRTERQRVYNELGSAYAAHDEARAGGPVSARSFKSFAEVKQYLSGQGLDVSGGGANGGGSGLFGALADGRFAGLYRAAVPFAGAAAIGLGGANAALRADQAVAAEYHQSAFDYLRRGAAQSQAYGGMGRGVLRNINTSLAASQFMADPHNLQSVFGKESRWAIIQQARKEAGLDSVGGVAGAISQDIGKAITDAFHSGGLEKVSADALLERSGVGRRPNINRTEWESKLQRFLNDYKIKMAGMVQSGVSMQEQTQNPFEADWRATFNSSYLQRIQLQRMARSSGAQSIGLGGAFTPEEHAAMRAQLGQVAGGRYLGKSGSMLSMQAGGLGNAAQLFGVAAGFGGGDQFMASLRSGSSMYGSQGLVDVQAASQVAQGYAGVMAGGNFFSSGQYGLEGELAATGLLGGDLRAARAMGAGNQAMAAYRGGGTDRLQRGINVLAASRAGGGNPLTMDALMEMPEEQRADILRNPNSKIPRMLQLQGITKENLRTYGQQADQFMFAEHMSSFSDPRVRQAVEAWRSGGGVQSLAGLSTGDMRTRIQELGVAAYQSKRALTPEAGVAMMAKLAESEGGELPALGGGTVGDVAGKLEREVKKQRDKETELQEGYYKSKQGTGDITAAVGEGAQKLAYYLGDTAGNINLEGKHLVKVIADLAEAIRTASPSTSNMPQHAAATAPRRPKTAPKGP